MKTDTDDTIRVTITLRRESHPEWYGVLKNVRSGRDRAEIVRTHLTLPRAAAMAISATPAPVRAAETYREGVAPPTPSTAKSDFSSPASDVNSWKRDTGTTEQSTVNPTVLQNPAVPLKNEPLNSPNPSDQRGGGLASVLLNANLGPNGKS